MYLLLRAYFVKFAFLKSFSLFSKVCICYWTICFLPLKFVPLRRARATRLDPIIMSAVCRLTSSTSSFLFRFICFNHRKQISFVNIGLCYIITKESNYNIYFSFALSNVAKMTGNYACLLKVLGNFPLKVHKQKCLIGLRSGE